MSIKLRFVAAAVAVAGLIAAVMPDAQAQSGAGIVISEFRLRGAVGGNDEFIELFNASAAPVNVGGWLIRGSNNNLPPAVSTRATIPAGIVINPGCFFLVTNSTATTGYSGSVPGNLTYATGITDDGGIALMRPDLSIVDQVGHGANGAYGEGTRLPTLTSNANRGIERRPGGAAGHADTNDNAADFQAIVPANPQNASSPCLAGGNPSISGSATPSVVEQGNLLTVFATVTPGSSPASTGLQVVGDLSAVGASVTAVLTDDGVAPDVTAGDNVFTTEVTVAPATAPGVKTLPLTVTDAQTRSANTSVSVTVIAPPVILLPHQIQGSGNLSPLPIGTAVTVRGVVTARKSNGFFIQTQVGMDDGDAATSEGLLVFTGSTPPAAAAVGQLVEVSGSVDEFGDAGVTVTEVKGNPTVTVTDLGAATIPEAYPLDLSFPSPTGGRDQLERLEGMRVSAASLTAVAGTAGSKNEAAATSSSFGEVDVVVTGHPRPFREPGLEPGTPAALTCAVGPCNLPQWDGNPELFRIDTNGIAGTTIRNVSTGAVFTDVTGPLDHAFGNYVILAETQLEPTGGLSFVAAPPAAPTQFTVASFNMERFYDTINDPGSDVALTVTAYDTRLNKASLVIRNVLNLPDIIGVQEVEKLDVLNAIAAKVNADAGADNPQYVAYLEEGIDPGGIDVGFLVKTAVGRVVVQSVEQVGLAATFVDPSDGSIDDLNDRPALVLRATVQGPVTALPQEVTVIVNHLRSLNGVDEDSATGTRVRAKRQAQAEFLANLIQGIQINDPGEAVISIGDYNAFTFNDGLGDSMGVIRGEPTPADQVVTASPDLVEPNLVDVAQFIPADEQYSYVFEGSAQTLDHVLVTQNLVPQFVDLVHPRINADVAEVLRGDATIPQRLSDHDPAVAYFTFPADTVAPVFTTTVSDQTLEATGPDGATATFATPSATDNLDAVVTVTCSPASGSIFAVASTGVTCSATDLAGNTATTSFSVTVEDTTAPVVTVPANITAQATSAAGAVVSFTASASDLVTASPAVTCAPSSGATFPVGVTTVTCTAADLAGNSASASFTVTVTAAAVVPGRIIGAGTVGTGRDLTWFTLDVRESANSIERGWLVLKVADRPGRPDRYLAANVTSVEFSNAPGYAPGRRPGSGVDTVRFTGVGYWNGHAGHTYEVVASDRGEPGRGRDTFQVVVKNAGGAVVASASGALRDGNLQSLR